MKDLTLIYSHCLHCPNPRCKASCPCGNEISQILSLLQQGEEQKAADLLHQTNPFPQWTSLLCDHARQCRGHCVRGIKGDPVDFPAVEQELSLRFPLPLSHKESNGKTVAIVGAGPAALSASYFLSREGFQVDVYERESGVGGAMLTGIPSFRFDKSGLEAARRDLEKMGVTFHFNQLVDQKMALDLREKHDFLILAIGARKENELALPQCEYIYGALPLLREYNLHGGLGLPEGIRRVIVMGGGNVAMDISRTLVRSGYQTELIYRRDEASMPAQKVEIAEAKADGVAFSPLTNVSSAKVDSSGKLLGLKLVQMRLGEPDESGRPSFHVIEGSEFDADCDAFVLAIGEKSSLSLDFPQVNGPNVFAIGDCSYGAKNIASAIASGREMAKTIAATLQ